MKTSAFIFVPQDDVLEWLGSTSFLRRSVKRLRAVRGVDHVVVVVADSLMAAVGHDLGAEYHTGTPPVHVVAHSQVVPEASKKINPWARAGLIIGAHDALADLEGATHVVVDTPYLPFLTAIVLERCLSCVQSGGMVCAPAYQPPDSLQWLLTAGQKSRGTVWAGGALAGMRTTLSQEKMPGRISEISVSAIDLICTQDADGLLIAKALVDNGVMD